MDRYSFNLVRQARQYLRAASLAVLMLPIPGLPSSYLDNIGYRRGKRLAPFILSVKGESADRP